MRRIKERISGAKETKLKIVVNEGEEWPDCSFADKLAFDSEEEQGGQSEDLEDGSNVKGGGGSSKEERDRRDGKEKGGGSKHKLGWAGKDEQKLVHQSVSSNVM